ncbi:hypothetical protein GQ43DRAFT_31272 [Delitschia confertaspora ATCC 74209]|uniref:Uncharacterized protein n=1 Tax=Delitschia confertaspora ATCC 74209 TaxID=1513339 RepID=A0A9P4JS46_9PLEO|nr:hypothetical protein GQ43DRAFT_31272 [Delitschia confertaspora ATCC 74209]
MMFFLAVNGVAYSCAGAMILAGDRHFAFSSLNSCKKPAVFALLLIHIRVSIDTYNDTKLMLHCCVKGQNRHVHEPAKHVQAVIDRKRVEGEVDDLTTGLAKNKAKQSVHVLASGDRDDKDIDIS